MRKGMPDEEQGISLKNPPPIVSSSTFGTIYYSGKKPISGRYKINFPRQLRYQGTKIDKQDLQST